MIAEDACITAKCPLMMGYEQSVIDARCSLASTVWRNLVSRSRMLITDVTMPRTTLRQSWGIIPPMLFFPFPRELL